MPIDVFAKQARRYVISGLFMTTLHVVIAACFIRFFLVIPPLANGLAFVLVTLCSYLVNTIWIFSSQPNKTTFIRFFMISLIGLFVAVMISAICEHFNLHYLYGIGLIACIVPPLTFLLNFFWTY